MRIAQNPEGFGMVQTVHIAQYPLGIEMRCWEGAKAHPDFNSTKPFAIASWCRETRSSFLRKRRTAHAPCATHGLVQL